MPLPTAPRSLRRTLAAAPALLAALLLAGGCTGEGGHDHDHDHAHDEDHDHDHAHDEDHGAEGAGGAESSHGHVHVAPHGGILIVLGDEAAHVELVIDRATGGAEALVLDDHAERGVPIEAAELRFRIEGLEEPLVLRPVASALTGETVGSTSRFAGEAPGLVGVESVAGALESIRVKGAEYREVGFRGKVGE